MFVREADESVVLGPRVRRRPGVPPRAYDDLQPRGHALRVSRADAAWVGWGFAAEQPAFAELCPRLGVLFVERRPAVMRLLGDKLAAKPLAERAGVPVASWSGTSSTPRSTRSRRRARSAFRVVIATAAGGGRGIREATPRRAARGLRASGRGGVEAFGDGRRLSRALVPRRAPRRGAHRRRPARSRLAPRRDRLHPPTPPSNVLEEAPSPALSTAETRRCGPRPSGSCSRRLPGRRHRRVPLRRAQPDRLLPRDERAPAGGASGDRVDQRARSGEVAAPPGARRRLGGDPPLRAGMRSGPRERGISGRGFAPAPGLVELLRLPAVRGSASIPASPRATRSRRSSTRRSPSSSPRSRSRRGARSLAPCSGRDAVVIRGGATTEPSFSGSSIAPRSPRRVRLGLARRLSAELVLLPRPRADVALLPAAIDAYEAEAAVERRSS